MLIIYVGITNFILPNETDNVLKGTNQRKFEIFDLFTLYRSDESILSLYSCLFVATSSAATACSSVINSCSAEPIAIYLFSHIILPWRSGGIKCLWNFWFLRIRHRPSKESRGWWRWLQHMRGSNVNQRRSSQSPGLKDDEKSWRSLPKEIGQCQSLIRRRWE